MGTVHRSAAVGLGVLLVACEPGPTAVGPTPAPRHLDATVQFNPQPEPPPQLFDFQMEGLLTGRLAGRLGEGGTVMVSTVEFMTRGGTVHLSQTWNVVPPDPIVPPEPIMLMGIADTSTGKLVLNGMTEDGVPVHVRGQIVPTGNGGVSIGGELMFNPQPEPPPSG